MYGVKVSHVAMALLVAFFIYGCSGTPGVTPESSDITNLPDPQSSATGDVFTNPPSTAQGRSLAGAFSIDFNPETEEIRFIPLREITAHFNATGYLMPPECYDCVYADVLLYQPLQHKISLNVYITNPTDISVYDVNGIIMTNQSGWKLINNFGYTPLYDDGPPVEYNPYIPFFWGEYYGKANYEFWPGTRVQQYDIEYPANPDFKNLKFLVDVSWPGLCNAPFRFTIDQAGMALDGAGGNFKLEAKSFRHDAQPENIIIDASPIGAGMVEMEMDYETAVGLNVVSRRWEATIDYPGVGNGIEAGIYDLIAAAITPPDAAIYQIIRAELHQATDLHEITPPGLNIEARELHVHGNYLLISDRNKLFVEDYSDPSSPVFLSSYPFDFTCTKELHNDSVLIAISDDNITSGGGNSASYDDRFSVVDISDPLAFETAASFDLYDEENGKRKFHLGNGYLYVHFEGSDIDSISSNTIQVYDIDPPVDSHLVTEIALPAGVYPRRSLLNQNVLYIIGREWLLLYEMTPTETFALACELPLEYFKRLDAIYYTGYLYIPQPAGISIFDVDPLVDAHYVSTVEIENHFSRMLEHGEYLYVSSYNDSNDYFTMPYSLSDPEAPTAFSPISGRIEGNVVTRTEDFVITAWNRIYIHDLTEPELPKVSIWDPPVGNPRYLAGVIADNLFAPEWGVGIVVLDISDPGSLSMDAINYKVCSPRDMAISDNACYITDYGDSGIKILDTSSPSQTVIAGNMFLPETVTSGRSLELWNGFLTRIHTGTGLSIYNISNPLEPQLLDIHPNEGARYMSAKGINAVLYGDELIPVRMFTPHNLFYEWTGPENTTSDYTIADLKYGHICALKEGYPAYTYRLDIFRTNVPFEASQITSLELPKSKGSMAYLNGYAYVNGYYGSVGLYIIDVDPPEDAHLKDHYYAPYVLEDIKPGENEIFVFSEMGMEVFTNDDSGWLHSKAFIDMPEAYHYSVDSIDGVLYVANSTSGLHIYEGW